MVLISGVVGTGTMTLVNAEHTVTVTAATTFTVPIQSAASGTYTSGGTVQPCVQVATPYTAAEVPELRVEQSADVLYVCHKNHPQYELRRTSATAWTFAAMSFDDGPFLDVNQDESILVYASATTGSVTLTATSAIFSADHVGALFYLEELNVEEVPPWEPAKRVETPTVYGLQRRSDGKVYRCVTANATNSKATGSEAPKHNAGIVADGDGSTVDGLAVIVGLQWEYLHSGYGVCRITAFGTTTSVTATVLSRLPDSVVGGATVAQGPWTMTGDGVDTTLSVTGATSSVAAQFEVVVADKFLEASGYTVDSATDVLTFVTAPANLAAVRATQLAANNRTNLWAFGAWSENQGYPSAVAFHEDRLVFAGSREQPQGVWASQTGDYTNFSKSVPLEDSDALTTAINARSVNAVTDLVPLSSLIALTSSGPWRVGPSGDEPLTPSTLFYKSQSKRKAAATPAVEVGEQALFAQYGGTKVRSLQYNLDANGYVGDELTVLARHMFGTEKTIVEMAYAEEPNNLVWAVRSDGWLVSLTYVPEQEVVAWARHHIGGDVKSACVVPESGLDVLYCVVERTVHGLTWRYIERVTDRDLADWLERVNVDSALSYEGRNDTAAAANLAQLTGWSMGDDLVVSFSGGVAFDSGDVGGEVWLYQSNGRALKLQIQSVSSPLSVTARPDRDVPAELQDVTTTSWAVAVDELSGMGHLAGETVLAQLDGAPLAELVVSDAGVVTLPYFTAIAHVGLPFDASIRTLPLTVVNRETIRWRQKTVPRVAVVVEDARGFLAGPDSANLEYQPIRDVEDDYEAVAPATELAEVQLSNTWEDTGEVEIWANPGAQLTVLNVIPDVVPGR
jgi:hypothetical protein